MASQELPFFFYDEKLKSDIDNLKPLFDKVIEASKELPKDLGQDKNKVYEGEDVDKLMNLFKVIVDSQNLYTTIVLTVVKRITASKDLLLEYSPYQEYLIEEVIKAQILRYYYGGEKMEDYIPAVQLQKKTTQLVIDIVNSNIKE